MKTSRVLCMLLVMVAVLGAPFILLHQKARATSTTLHRHMTTAGSSAGASPEDEAVVETNHGAEVSPKTQEALVATQPPKVTEATAAPTPISRNSEGGEEQNEGMDGDEPRDEDDAASPNEGGTARPTTTTTSTPKPTKPPRTPAVVDDSSADQEKESTNSGTFRRLDAMFNKCKFYEEADATDREGDSETFKVVLHARNYMNDVDCNMLGGWKHDPHITNPLFTRHCDLDRYDINQLTLEGFNKLIRGKAPAIFVDPTGERSFRKVKKFFRSLSRKTLLREAGSQIISTARTAVKDLDLRSGADADPSAVGRGSEYSIADYIKMMDQPWKAGVDKRKKSDYIIGNYDDKAVPTVVSDRTNNAPFLTLDFMHKQGESSSVRLFVMGASGSGAPFHQHNPAWSHQFYGMKRWFLRPPNLKRAVAVTEGPYRNTTFQWYHDKGPLGYEAMRKKDPRHLTLKECIQMPGETFYLPALWWHSTINIAQSVSIAQFDV